MPAGWVNDVTWPPFESTMRTTAPSTFRYDVSVSGWFGSPRGTIWFPTRNSATYALTMPTSRTPDVRWGCVGSTVNVHVMPGVTNCGASTPSTKRVLSSCTQAATIEPIAATPATSERPDKTCPQTRFIGILQRVDAHSCRHPPHSHRPNTRANQQTVPLRRPKRQKRAEVAAAVPSDERSVLRQHRGAQVRHAHALDVRAPRRRDHREADGVLDELLVLGDERPRRGHFGRIRADRETQRSEEIGGPIDERRRRPAEGGRGLHLDHRAERDGLAVKPSRVAPVGLERVSDRVAQVEERPRAGLPLVVAHDADLGVDRLAHHGEEGVGVSAGERPRVSLERFEEREVRGERDLHDLGQTGRTLARGVRRQVAEIRDDGARR